MYFWILRSKSTHASAGVNSGQREGLPRLYVMNDGANTLPLLESRTLRFCGSLVGHSFDIHYFLASHAGTKVSLPMGYFKYTLHW